MLWVPTKALNIQLMTDQAQALVEYSTVFHTNYGLDQDEQFDATQMCEVYTTHSFGRSVAAVVKRLCHM